ncbi:hypothetical protein PM082_004564 [Marasmius tenuissimus]|nr:hypothetical protein PM082_004564 [Marasmius tenuissimus]
MGLRFCKQLEGARTTKTRRGGKRTLYEGVADDDETQYADTPECQQQENTRRYPNADAADKDEDFPVSTQPGPQEVTSVEQELTEHEAAQELGIGGDGFPEDAPQETQQHGNVNADIEELLRQAQTLGLKEKVQEKLDSAPGLESYAILGILHELLGQGARIPRPSASGSLPAEANRKPLQPSQPKPSGPHRRPKRRAKRQNEQRKDIRERLVELAFPNKAPITSVTPQQRIAFEQGRASGPTQVAFGLDLCSKKRWTKWNKRAADVFVEYYTSLEDNEEVDESVVRETFRTYLKTLQDRYFNLHPTEAMLQERLEDRRNARRRRRCEIRLEQLFLRNQMYSGPGWQGLMPAYDSLTPEMMSGDETDVEDNTKFIKTRVIWRSKELEDFLHLLSALYIASQYLNNGKYSPGEFPAPREDSQRPDSIYQQAPIGLPINWYDEIWLNAEPHRLASLRVKPPLKLVIPSDHLNVFYT